MTATKRLWLGLPVSSHMHSPNGPRHAEWSKKRSPNVNRFHRALTLASTLARVESRHGPVAPSFGKAAWQQVEPLAFDFVASTAVRIDVHPSDLCILTAPDTQISKNLQAVPRPQETRA